MELSGEAWRDLREAHALLENPGLAARLTHLIGMPLAQALSMLPDNWADKIHQASRLALEKNLAFVSRGLHNRNASRWNQSQLLKWANTASGAIGGAFGLPALLLELPVSTSLLLRGIAAEAVRSGEDLDAVPGRLACLEVFALGGTSADDDASESGYFGVRLALARAVSEAAEFVAAGRLASESAPLLVRLLQQVAARFGLIVSQKAAAQAVPIVGAASGALINYAFSDHFTKMAYGHFTVRRLERSYGHDLVRSSYASLANEENNQNN
jgi:hypothetical protein